MKKERKKLLAFSATVFCVLFLLGITYSFYDTLIEADFISKGLKFEAADLETICADKQTDLNLGINTLSVVFSPNISFLEHFTAPPFQGSPFERSLRILRC
jgi:hypothetical protein